MDGQHQVIPQHCWVPQGSSSSNHGQNIVHAPPHAPICSMGPPLNGGQLYHCVSDINGGGANAVGSILTSQHQPSHSATSSGVMLNIMQYPNGAKSSIVNASAADTNHPQGPLPPTPIEPESSIIEVQPQNIMELPPRPASAGAAAISAAAYLGLETGSQNYVGQRQRQHFPLFHQQMEPVRSHQGVPAASSIPRVPPVVSSSGGVRELTSSRRGAQLRKQQSISCAYEYCDDKIGPISHQPHLQSIPDIHG